MKKFLLSVMMLGGILSISAMPIALSSIISENDGVEEVTTFIYENSDKDLCDEWTMGELLKVNDGYSEFTFDYSQLSSNLLTMIREDKDGEITKYELILNDEGYVVKALEYNNGILDEDYCTFEYTDGCLTLYRQISQDGIEESSITYDESGQVIKVENTDSSDESATEISYFEYEHPLGTDAFGSFWDWFYNVDIDDLEWVAFAGYLGKNANTLPSKITRNRQSGEEVKLVDWNTNVYGYPTWITVTENNNADKFIIEWYNNAACDLKPITGDKKSSSRFYNINGVEVSGDTKGIVIERKGDGSTVKRLNR